VRNVALTYLQNDVIAGDESRLFTLVAVLFLHNNCDIYVYSVNFWLVGNNCLNISVFVINNDHLAVSGSRWIMIGKTRASLTHRVHFQRGPAYPYYIRL